LIRARTGEGRERAKAKGVKMGRKPKLTPHQKREAIKRRDKRRRNFAFDRTQLQCQPGDDSEACGAAVMLSMG
jgi:DNA invertase Pin-like site-specific DNA recombinase